MPYEVILKKSVKKELEKLPEPLHRKLIQHLHALESNPRPVGVKKLQGREAYRTRVGSYRVLYEIDDAKKRIQVFSIGDRKDVYRV